MWTSVRASAMLASLIWLASVIVMSLDAAIPQPPPVIRVVQATPGVPVIAAVVTDHWSFGFCALGAILGGCVAQILRRKLDASYTANGVAYAAVATATSLCLSPYILLRWISQQPSPDECLAVAFATAAVAWFGWEITFAIGSRLRKAAIDRGWIGVKDEVTGRNRDVTS